MYSYHCQCDDGSLDYCSPQYFTEVIVAASKEDDADERLESLNTAHSLIVQINRSVPALLLNVIPQMEEELRAEEVQLRTLATQVLGQMFAEKPAKSGGGGGDLARKYPNTWRAWLGRSKDRSSSLRVVWVEAMKALLINHPELGTDLTPLIKEKLVEPDEKVRAALCRVFSVLDYETALHHVEKSVLLVIAERCKDKKTSVRADAQHALARMFDMAYSEIESHDPAATQQFAWIPGAILKCLFAGDKELYQQTTATMAKYILPLPQRAEDEAVWVNRLLLVMKHLDDSATKALQRLTGLVQTRPSPYDAVLDGCEAYNGGIIDEDEEGVKTRLAHAIKICASQFAEPLKAANDLQTFAKMNEVRIYKLIKLCMDPQTDLKSYLKNHAEAVRRIEAASPAIVETMTTFLRNGSYPFVNRSSLPTLVRRLAQPRADFTASQLAPLSQSQSQSQTQSASLGISSASDVDAFKTSAKLMLEFVAKRCPAMYKAHVPELAKAISEEDNPVLVEVCLRALAAVAKDDPSAAPSDRRTLQRVRTLVSLGTPSQAKYAARFLALASRSRGERTGKGKGADATVALDELLEELARALPKTTGERLVAHLSAIAQFFKHVPEASEDKADSIVREVLQGILMKPRSKDGPPALDEDAAEDWVEDDQMDAQLRAKLLGLDILTKRSVAFAETDNATELAVPVFRLLWQTLSDGEPRKNGAR